MITVVKFYYQDTLMREKHYQNRSDAWIAQKVAEWEDEDRVNHYCDVFTVADLFADQR